MSGKREREGTDPSGRRVMTAQDAGECAAAGGTWSDGKCWTRAADAACAKADGSADACGKEAACQLEPVTERCFSAEALAALGDEALPDVPSEGVPAYLEKYFASRAPAGPLAPLLGPSCFGDTSPAAHQTEVRLLLGSMLKEKRRGLVVWHSTGSGKLCTAASALDAFWATKRPLWYVSTEAALKLNPIAKVQRCALAKLPRFKRLAGPEPKAGAAAAAAAFAERGVRAMTYEQLAAEPSLPADVVLVADEAHHLLEPRFLLLQRALSRPPRGVVLVALTATPGPYPEATLALLNLARPARSAPYKLGDAGLETRLREERVVSYYDASDDARHFAKLRYREPPADDGKPAEAKVPALVDAILAAPSDAHIVWAPGHAQAVKDALAAAKVGFDVADRDAAARFNAEQGARVLLIDDAGLGEALDVRGVKHVHVLDEGLDDNGLKQVVGRAWRYCSHARLPAEDWTIDVHVYLARVDGKPALRLRKLQGLAARGMELNALLADLVDAVSASTGVDVAGADEDAAALPPAKAKAARAKLDKAVRAALAKLAKADGDAAKRAATVWEDLPKLHAEYDKVARELHESDLRTLADVHAFDRAVTKAQAGDADAHVAFYDLLRRAAAGKARAA